MNKSRSLCCWPLAFALLTFAFAQTTPTNSSPKLNSVSVPLFAVGHDKRPYSDLKKNDITILDNKQPVRTIISLKKGSELPLRLGLLIDASNSQRKSELYKPEVLAAWDFLNQILKGPDVKLFVVKVTVVPEASGFMDASELRAYKLDVAPEGGTALYDGIGYACDSRMSTVEPQVRRVLVVLSDGDDNMSHISRDTAIAKAQQRGVVIFPVSTEDESSAPYSHGEKGYNTLEHFADDTGGEAFLHLDRKKVERTFLSMTEAINNMYLVTFEPVKASDKGLHRIELRVPGNDKIRIRAPRGFYLK